MALIPLNFHVSADNIPFVHWLRLKSFVSMLLVDSEEWARFFESGIRERSEGKLCWRGDEIHLVIDWSMQKQPSPCLCISLNPEELDLDYHRVAIPFLLTDLARDAGINFSGRVMDLVDVLRSATWESICKNLTLLHYTSQLAELVNMEANNSKEPA